MERAILALALIGCGTTEPRALEVPPTEATPSSLLDCEGFGLAWATPTGGIYQQQRIGASGGLLRRSDAQRTEIFRVVDGAFFQADAGLALSPDWRLEAENRDEVLTVRETSTKDARFELPVPAEPGLSTRRSRPVWLDRRTVAWTECASTRTNGPFDARLSMADVQDASVRSLFIPSVQPFGPWCSDAPSILTSDDGFVIVAGMYEGQLDRIDPVAAQHVDGTVVSFDDPVPVLGPEEHVPVERPILPIRSAALEQNVLVITGTDGQLRRFDPRSLEPVGEPIPTGVVGANMQTFLPSIESPVALSPDASILAYVDRDGRVVLSDILGSSKRVLDGPFEEGDAEWVGNANAPMSISIQPDAVVVGYEAGMARWACAPTTPGLTEIDGVQIEGPAELTLGRGPPEYRVTHPLGDRPVVSGLTFGGQPGSASLSDRVTAYASERGTFTLEVRVTDGRSEGRASMEVVVR